MRTFDRAHILVVGGAGFVGSNLVRELTSHSTARVLVVDNLLSAERTNLPQSKQVDFLEGSIAHDGLLSQLPGGLDFVFHLATNQWDWNAARKLFEHLKSFKQLKKIVCASCTVADETDAHAATAGDLISPGSDTPNPMPKVFDEFHAHHYFTAHHLPIVKARFQNVYGPGEILGAGQWRGAAAPVWRSVVPTFIYRALKEMPLRVENGGGASHDFVYARDIARGLMLCAAFGEAGEEYALASGTETSILDLANQINQLASSKTPLERAPLRGWERSAKRTGSTEKAREKIHFAAEMNLSDGLKTTIEWTKANLPLIEKCIAKHQTQLAAA